MNRRALLGAVAGAGSVLLAGCSISPGPEVRREETRTLDAADVERLRVVNRQGDVSVTGSAGTSLTVTARKRTREGEDALDAARLETSRSAGTLTLRGVRDATGILRDDPQVTMSLEISVPTGGSDPIALALAETGLGDVDVRDVPGTPELVSGLGDVVGTGIEGFTRAYSALGDVDVEVRSVPGQECIARTKLGDVALRIPPSLDCDLEATVELGSIVSNGVELTTLSASDSELSARLGDGGNRIEASSDLGDVHLWSLSTDCAGTGDAWPGCT